MSFHTAEPRVEHLSSKRHAILYKRSVTGGWKSAASSFSVLRRGNDRDKENVWKQRVYFHSSGALVFKVSLFDAPAEGQQVAVALDPLCQLCARKSGGEDGEEVTKHQSIQFCRPVKYMHSVFISLEIDQLI